MVFQLFIFIGIQVIAIALTFYYLNNRYQAVMDDFRKRLKKYHLLQIKNKNIISKLENQLVEVNSKVNDTSDGNKKVSNIGSVGSVE